MVRAKFRCGDKKAENVTVWQDGQVVPVEAHSIYMHAVCDGSEENKAFFASSPGGNFHLYAVNAAAAEQFAIGREYYFDIHPADGE